MLRYGEHKCVHDEIVPVIENLEENIKDANKRNFRTKFHLKAGIGAEFTAYESRIMKKSSADIIHVIRRT